MAWTITAATVYHELAQEISDYMVRPPPPFARLAAHPHPNHRHPPPVKNKALGA
jgi:hypothetical protein